MRLVDPFVDPMLLGLWVGALVFFSGLLLLPARYVPWPWLDRAVVHAFAKIVQVVRGEVVTASTQRDENAAERVQLMKLFLVLACLVVVFPFNTLTGTSGIVRVIWGAVDSFKETLGYHDHLVSAHVEFDNWELCIFLWIVLLVPRMLKADFLRAIESDKGDAYDHTAMFNLGSAFSIGYAVLGVVAFVCLMVFHGWLRLAFEIFIICCFAGFDFWLGRRYYRENNPKAAKGFLQSLTFVEVPALIGMTLLLLFILWAPALGFAGDWVRPFTAGASALNLLFVGTATTSVRGRALVANSLIFVERVQQGAEEARQKALLQEARQTAGREKAGLRKIAEEGADEEQGTPGATATATATPPGTGGAGSTGNS